MVAFNPRWQFQLDSPSGLPPGTSTMPVRSLDRHFSKYGETGKIRFLPTVYGTAKAALRHRAVFLARSASDLCDRYNADGDPGRNQRAANEALTETLSA